MSSLYKALETSGLVYQCSSQERFDELTQQPGQIAYAGFDCTADSFHVGNLALIMLMRKWQKSGHKPVILLGGGTTLVGDPSGKDKVRQMLTRETIENNKKSLRKIFEKFLDFDTESANAAVIVDNHDWLKDIDFLSFLREIGPHFTLNRLLTFDSIKSRLDREQPLSYLEFNYMILQAYDFYSLYKNHQVLFQFGGSDQWGNMISGLELIRKVSQEQGCVLTIPLLTTADGKKMGKSENGAIWLNADKLSDFDYWQFWRNCHDDDIERFLKIYTDLSMELIDDLVLKHKDNPNPLKEILANEATALLRGQEASEKSAQAAKELFKTGLSGGIENLPKLSVTDTSFDTEALIDFLVSADVFVSKGACRKMIAQGGVKIDSEKVTDSQLLLKDILKLSAEGKCLLSIGKKKHYLLQRI